VKFGSPIFCEVYFGQGEMKLFVTLSFLFGLLPFVTVAGPLAYGIGQTGCNAVVVATLQLDLLLEPSGRCVPAAIVACKAL
jgi:hypothetical protein